MEDIVRNELKDTLGIERPKYRDAPVREAATRLERASKTIKTEITEQIARE